MPPGTSVLFKRQGPWLEAFRGLRRASPAERRSSRIVVGLRHRPSSGLQAIEPGEQVFDVGRQILRRNVLGGPSQGRADAGEEVDIVDARAVFRVLHFPPRCERPRPTPGRKGRARRTARVAPDRVPTQPLRWSISSLSCIPSLGEICNSRRGISETLKHGCRESNPGPRASCRGLHRRAASRRLAAYLSLEDAQHCRFLAR